MKEIIFITLAAILFLHCSSIGKKDGSYGFLRDAPEDEESDSFFGDAPEDPSAQDPPNPVEKQVGYATWYGRELHGKPTASGEIFDMNGHTASHRTYPMGSTIVVRNLGNNKKKVLRINDRGPYVEGRVIDVSYAAARELGFAEKGIAKVEIELVKKGKFSFLGKLGYKAGQKESDFFFADGIRPTGYTIQVGAFKIRGNAERFRDEMEERFSRRVFIATQGKWHYVWIGNFEGSQKARSFMEELKSEDVDVMYRGKT